MAHQTPTVDPKVHSRVEDIVQLAPASNGELADAYDIKIGDSERSWNLDTNDPWAIAEGSIEEVGCIHTCQVLDFGYVGVIIGNDLKYRNGEIVVDHEARATTDRSLFGIKKMFDEQPEEAAELADELIKTPTGHC